MKSPKKAEQNEQKLQAEKSTPDHGSRQAGGSNGSEPGGDIDAVTLLKNDHRAVEKLFEQFEREESNEGKRRIAEQVCSALIVHAMIEEEIFYGACREANIADDKLDESQVEHDGAKVLIADVITEGPDHEFYEAKVKVLAEYVKHHVAEEEEPENGILAKAESSSEMDLKELGQKLQIRKTELMQNGAEHGFDLPRMRSLHAHPQQWDNQKENRKMDRSMRTPDRDDRGRFVSDDEDDQGGRYARSERDDDRRRSRSRYEDDDDRRSSRGERGWSGDPEGHAEAARRGWESRRSDDDYDDRRYRSRDDDDYGRSRQGDRGWYGDSEGHAEAARRGWDERASSRSRRRDDDDDDRRSSRSREGRGGWFGDSRGHAEAARRGWDNPDHGPSGWYGDSEGHSEASRRGWDNPDHRPSGWFGDREGHSRAARERWDDEPRRRSRRERD